MRTTFLFKISTIGKAVRLSNSEQLRSFDIISLLPLKQNKKLFYNFQTTLYIRFDSTTPVQPFNHKSYVIQ